MILRGSRAAVAAFALAAALAAPAAALDAPPVPVPAAADDPAWARDLPATTTQVVRTVSTDQWCADIWCTRTEAWERGPDGWHPAQAEGAPAVFRSQIGPNGWDKRKEGDARTPSGVFKIVVTSSTTETAPGKMPWRRRLPTSTVSPEPGPDYNTWLEVPGVTTGDRPSMRYGFLVDYNNPRLTPGVGPKPVTDAGSGIFFHTSKPGAEWEPTLGCVQVGRPAQMLWLLRWLDPEADPRVVLDR